MGKNESDGLHGHAFTVGSLFLVMHVTYSWLCMELSGWAERRIFLALACRANTSEILHGGGRHLIGLASLNLAVLRRFFGQNALVSGEKS